MVRTMKMKPFVKNVFKVSIPSRRGNGSDTIKLILQGQQSWSQSPQGGAMVRTPYCLEARLAKALSQSPQGGAMVRTLLNYFLT